MVVDINKLTSEPSTGLLTVVDMAPDTFAKLDVTELLNEAKPGAQGYFASYNVPRDPAIQTALGYPVAASMFTAYKVCIPYARSVDQPAAMTAA